MLFLFCLRMGPIALGMYAEVKYAFMWKMLMDKSTFFVFFFFISRVLPHLVLPGSTMQTFRENI